MSGDSAEGAGGLLAGLGPGSRVGGYRLEEQVGAGGMAVVFRARDERLGRRVALKVLAPALAADAGFRQRFLRESRAAAAVDDPHILPVYEAGDADGVLFIAMRFVPGGDVRSLLAQAGPLVPERAAAIVSPVASALDAAHAAGLVHRDVKPANMLVDVRPDRPDHVYLSDFGLSKGTLSSADLTGAGQALGTPDYMAPEQIEGRAADGRTDQYALACAAFELLCGEPPFRRDQGMAVLFAHLHQPPPSLSARQPELPNAVDAVFARALAKDPADRYPACRQFADALREALDVAAYHTAPGASPAAGRPSASHPATEIARPAAAAVDTATTAAPAPTPAGAADAGPTDSPAGVAEMPEAVLITGPDRPSRDADDAAPPEAPTATAGEAAPAAAATATADSHPAAAPAKAVWIRRHRLPLLALVCAVVAAAGVIPFMVRNPASSPRPAKSPTSASPFQGGVVLLPEYSPDPAPSPSYSDGYISFANLSPAISAVDVYLYKSGSSSAQSVEHDITYGTVLPYESVSAGHYSVEMRVAGSAAANQPVLSASVTVHAGDAYTAVAITLAARGRQLTVVSDNLTTPTGQFLVQAIQASLNRKRATLNPKTVTFCHAELAIYGPNAGLKIVNQQPCPRPQA